MKESHVSRRMGILAICATFIAVMAISLGAASAYAQPTIDKAMPTAEKALSIDASASAKVMTADQLASMLDIGELDEPAATTMSEKYEGLEYTGRRTRGTAELGIAYDGNRNPFYFLSLKSATITGSVVVSDDLPLRIYSSGTCYIKGGIDCNGVQIAGTSTLYVYGGINSKSVVIVDRTDNSKSFKLKAYNKNKTKTKHGIKAGTGLYVVNEAKVYASGYKSSTSSNNGYGIYSAELISVSGKAYARGTGKYRGIKAPYIYVEQSKLRGNCTASTSFSKRFSSSRRCGITCTSLIVNNTGYADGYVYGRATGKYSTGLSVDSALESVNSKIKGYAKNHGYGILTTAGTASFTNSSVYATGGNIGLIALGVKNSATGNYDDSNVDFDGGKAYLYGKNAKGTRTGDGALIYGEANFRNMDKCIVYAKSSTKYAGIETTGRINIYRSNMTVHAKKNYAVVSDENGGIQIINSYVKRNSTRISDGFYNRF